MPGGYAYDNDVDVALQQHACLSAMLDDFTFSRLSTVALPRRARCLEVGAGAGSVARWLAGRGASVVATDLKPRHLRADAGIRVLAHDITAEPVPDPPYDLIHARLLLLHLPEREEVLRRLADALRPGGSLVVEDWYIRTEHLVVDAPGPGDVTLFERYQRALLGILDNDPAWAARIHTEMLAAGLRDVDTAIHSPVWPAGSPATPHPLAVDQGLGWRVGRRVPPPPPWSTARGGRAAGRVISALATRVRPYIEPHGDPGSSAA